LSYERWVDGFVEFVRLHSEKLRVRCFAQIFRIMQETRCDVG
jgi:hypothetical protein